MKERVLITGACGNLGRAVRKHFSEKGYAVALLDQNMLQLRELYGSDSDTQVCIEADLLSFESVNAAVKTVISVFERIDILCNLAGGFRMGEPVHETSDATWSFLFGLNATSVLNTSRSVVPHMLNNGGGSIVNVGAAAATKGGAGMGAYSASKSVVVRLTESMSEELKEHGIRVNCVLPSILDTPENRADMRSADFSRWVAPAKLARVIGFLGSDDASDIHGVSLPVNGLT